MEPKSDLIQITIPEKFDGKIYLADIAKSIERIQLETAEGALLGYVREVMLLDDKFYLGDSKISVFDREGKFIGRFGNQGNGPGEYVSISSMTLDPEAGLVYVASGKKIMVYTKEGKFLEEKSFRMFVNYLIAEYTIEWEKMMFLYDKRISKGYNLNGGVLDEDGEPLILYPMDLTKDIFYFVKSVEYQDATIEEANPVIGIVRLK
ncbi:6-bladed beta-propeller [Aquiflexum lacus]|uniref:6-bladed beta-propeller n=1 Tax=Aquiflexum lacus TaxID=2483805 RepID=UPI001895B8E1|nr:6-bladed beta-propeller [Aquiflexum lacus]